MGRGRAARGDRTGRPSQPEVRCGSPSHKRPPPRQARLTLDAGERAERAPSSEAKSGWRRRRSGAAEVASTPSPVRPPQHRKYLVRASCGSARSRVVEGLMHGRFPGRWLAAPARREGYTRLPKLCLCTCRSVRIVAPSGRDLSSYIDGARHTSTLRRKLGAQAVESARESCVALGCVRLRRGRSDAEQRRSFVPAPYSPGRHLTWPDLWPGRGRFPQVRPWVEGAERALFRGRLTNREQGSYKGYFETLDDVPLRIRSRLQEGGDWWAPVS